MKDDKAVKIKVNGTITIEGTNCKTKAWYWFKKKIEENNMKLDEDFTIT